MTYHVHLYNVGKSPDTAFSVIKTEIPMDKLYLLNNDNPEYVAVEDAIRKKFEGMGLDGIETLKINPFDYRDVFNAVLDTYKRECESHGDVRFHINFTMGTSIVVGAVCSAAYSINADLYYIQESIYSRSGKDEIIRIEVESFEEEFELRNKKQTLEVFLRFLDRKPKSNTDLIGGLRSPSSLTYHTRYLSEKGLIERKGSVRNTEWTLTRKGEHLIKRL